MSFPSPDGLTLPPSNLFVRVTDEIVANLRADENLSEGLSEGVVVFKGPRRLASVADRHAVFVYRSGLDNWEYWMGDQQVEIDGVWAVTCVTRHVGDPEQLEDYVSTLAANVLRNLMWFKQTDNWLTGTPGPSTCVTGRGEEDQSWEIELIPFLLNWNQELEVAEA